ncbi:monocarboxylate transporter 12-B-like [Liolophura sinensis]|uniref:monocarboxylate transporter 12-B-like n=1 Tax=Liolophura sinensis TaxID=3198878 RepID=UPI0031584BB5
MTGCSIDLCYIVIVLASGLLVNAFLGDIFREGPLVIAAGLLASAGHLTASLANSAELIIFPLGLCSGAAMTIGLGGCITALGRHFKTRLPVVTSLTLAGSALAGFVLPPLILTLLEKYGNHGALLILSGLTLNLVVTGALLGTNERVGTSQKQELVKKEPDPPVFTVLQAHGSSAKTQVNFGDLKDNGATQSTSRRRAPKRSGIRAFLLKKRRGRETISHKQILNVALCKSPLFVIYQFFTLLAVMSCNVSQQYLAANAEDVGFTNVQAAYLLSIIGACDLIGRVAFGVLCHLGWFERYKIFMVSQLVLGTAMIVTPFIQTVELQGIFCAVVGLQIGVFYPAIPVTLDDFFGRQNLYKSIGINQCVQGIGSLIASFYTGYLRDLTGSYTLAFVVSGSSSVLASAVLSGVALTRRATHRKTMDITVTGSRELVSQSLVLSRVTWRPESSHVTDQKKISGYINDIQFTQLHEL